jgi:Transglutaminase-like superfamily
VIRRAARASRFGAATVAAVYRLLLVEHALSAATLSQVCASLGIRLDLDSGDMASTEAPVLPRSMAIPLQARLAVAARWPAGDTCLRRCLLVGHRLRALRPVLRIGVRREGGGRFRAHSWLELDGRTLDASAADFAVLCGLATTVR